MLVAGRVADRAGGKEQRAWKGNNACLTGSYHGADQSHTESLGGVWRGVTGFWGGWALIVIL